MATSGDYRIFFEHDGQRYWHEIDPATGAPMRHGLASVSVVAPDCAFADAMATALIVLGPDKGYALAVARTSPPTSSSASGGRRADRQTPAFAALGGTPFTGAAIGWLPSVVAVVPRGDNIIFAVAFAAMAIRPWCRGAAWRLLRRARRDRPGGRAPVLLHVPQPEQGRRDEAIRDRRREAVPRIAARAGPLPRQCSRCLDLRTASGSSRRAPGPRTLFALRRSCQKR